MGSIDGITQYQKSNTYTKTPQTEAVKEAGSGAGKAQLAELTAGKILEGTVTEMKNGQVTIGLTNGQSIMARMEGSVNLKLGEPMLFEVRSNNGSQISIRPVSVESSLNPTLNQALKAAGISVSERNAAMVHAMMKEQMPIDKNSLLNMLKLSMQFRNSDVATVVQMSKLNFHITEASISQFENYKTNQHILLEQMHDFMGGLPDVMKGGYAMPKEILSFQQQLLDIFKQPDAARPDTLTKVPEQVQEISGEGTNTFLPQGEASFYTGNGQNARTLTEMLKDIMEGGKSAPNLPSERESNISPMPPDGAVKGQVLQEPGTAGTEAVGTEAVGTEAVGTEAVLSSKEIIELTGQLKEFPQALQEKGLFQDGALNTSLTPQQLLETIQRALNSSEGYLSASLQKLFYGDAYQKLMRHVIEQQWTVSPQEIEGQHEIEKFYEKLNHQLNELHKLLESAGQESTTLSRSVDNMRSNLDFMNQVNQMYNYIQIPLKLNNQNAHSDLYVYTNKKSLQDKEGELTALLHLDMEHLGATDIYIKLKEHDVTTTFYLADDTAFQLIAGSTQILQKKLEEKGYFCTVTVENRKKEQDFVEDFLKQEQPLGKVHRYSFDVKA